MSMDNVQRTGKAENLIRCCSEQHIAESADRERDIPIAGNTVYILEQDKLHPPIIEAERPL